MKKKEISLFLLVIFIGLVLRFYNLNNLPMEMYGDIVEGYKFTQEILTGKWPFYFVLGNGPLFFYFVAIIAKIFGLYFLTMKIASAIVGVGIIIITYCLGKELFGKETGLITAFLIAVSKWPLIFSRLGNMPILVPLFTSIIYLLFFKISKNPKNNKDWVMLGTFLGLGLYVYPAFFINPIAVFFLFLSLGFHFWKKNWAKMFASLIFFLIFASKFYFLISGNLQGWVDSNSYFGGKIFVSQGKLAEDWPQKLKSNIVKTALMFNFIEADHSVRNNGSKQSALDFVSGVFLWLGLISGIWRKENRKNTVLVLLGTFLLMFPAILVLNVSSDVPSMCRTIGAIPLIFVLVGHGGSFFIKTLKRILIKPSGVWKVVFLLGILIIFLNAKMYFKDYAFSLPNHNEGFPYLIAQYVDRLPDNTQIFMYKGGWAEWYQPDWRAVSYEFKTPKKYTHIEKGEFNCQFFDPLISPKYFILDPGSTQDLAEIKNCLLGGKEEMHFSPKYHFPLFVSYHLP